MDKLKRIFNLGVVKEMTGKLFICATPIGNIRDITIRVIKTLKEIDLIAAEDTRQTRKLCHRYRIKSPLTSYHQYNERTRSKELVEKMKLGKNVALVSNAGIPGLSDPGHHLIKVCIEAGIPIEVLPGPNAAIAALVISGLPTNRFAFEGFLPRKRGERRRALNRLTNEGRTLVLYESCHRIASLIEDMVEIFGERRVVLVRELTKKFEEVIRGSLGEALKLTRERQLKGEIVIIVEGMPEKREEHSDEFIKARVKELREKGFSKRDAIAEVANSIGLARRIIYEKIKTQDD